MSAILKWLQRFESVIAAIAYAIVAGLLLGEIVAREFFASSIWGSQRMAVFAAIFAGFLGLTLTTGVNGHLRPQFADRWLPAAWDTAVARFGDFLSAIIFLSMAWFSSAYIGETFTNGDQAAVLYWPLWPLQLVLPYAFVSCALKHTIFGLKPALKPAASLME